MNPFFQNIIDGKFARANAVVETALKEKCGDSIAEERLRVAAMLFEGDILEAENHPVPGLNKWNMYAGGTAGGGKHSYDHYLDDGKDKEGKSKGPTARTQYSISPVTHSNGRFRYYRVGAWSPDAGHSHKDLGVVRDPREGVKLARAHYDQNFGKK